MEVANSRQQTNTEIVMDTQTEVKQFVQYAVMSAATLIGFNDKVLKIIVDGLEEIDDEQLKEVATRTLFRYAQQEFARLSQMLGFGVLAAALINYKKEAVKDVDVKLVQDVIDKTIKDLPMATLNETFSQLGNSQAKVSFGQSLLGKAERDARYNSQKDRIDNYRASGVKLVIADTHSDCSDRCKEWQGRVYSLDGTSGRTEEGKQYVPLEVATNAVFKGHVNGLLLGYNCRHNIVPYKTGMQPNRVSEKERKRQNEITAQQRQFEREIRNAKEKALAFKQGSENTRQFNKQQIEFMKAKYNFYKNKTTELMNAYNQFCEQNNRVKYRSRLQV